MTILDFNNTPLLKTGQVTNRTPAGRTCLDDGGDQKGQLHSYEILTTGQYSGTTNITVNAKTDVHSNEVAIDHATGLMWSRTLSASVGPTSNGLLAWDDTAGVNEDCFEYCDQANSAALSGYDDWRIPNIFELFCLSNIGPGNNGHPDSTIFPAWQNNVFSSTSRPDLNVRALFAQFNTGTIGDVTKTTTGFAYAVLVRLGFN